MLSQKRDQTVDVGLERTSGGQSGKRVTLPVPPQPFRSLGIQMDIGKITSVRPDSPAARAGLQLSSQLLRLAVSVRGGPR